MRVCFAGAVQSQWRAEQALLKEFLQAQEAAHLAELEARRTADALKMQEELLAVETDRRAVEEEKQRIEEEKRRALADIEKRTQVALVALEVRTLVVWRRFWACPRTNCNVHIVTSSALPCPSCFCICDDRRSVRKQRRKRWRARPS